MTIIECRNFFSESMDIWRHIGGDSSNAYLKAPTFIVCPPVHPFRLPNDRQTDRQTSMYYAVNIRVYYVYYAIYFSP